MHDRLPPKKVCLGPRDLLKYVKCDISETIQNRDTSVAIED